VARGVGRQASTPPNEPRAHRRWVWAASDLLIGRAARQSTNCPQEARSAHADGDAFGPFRKLLVLRWLAGYGGMIF
jgi:hypothetical protein